MVWIKYGFGLQDRGDGTVGVDDHPRFSSHYISLLGLSFVCSSFEPRFRVNKYSLPFSINILRILSIVSSFAGRPSIASMMSLSWMPASAPALFFSTSLTTTTE